ncbi:hypothetical protein KM1_004730 [Entamoeba histolytica HM-3:IMSS]|uniref:UBR-type domain-containing protein n=2 Tax=Entamoeba histolytica TaxID=5759 RepID=M2Q0H5_ENTHI|nr:Hypothetical protein EHI5A_006390 [Entamoeba histolytica KU27]EMS16627.1 hypothetical protein KM1_004730 [Entamoeba histolytica HM-3:IMSS]
MKIPSIKNIHVYLDLLFNGEPIDSILQVFDPTLKYKDIVETSHSQYCLSVVEKYYTCLTCSEGKVKYCCRCFDFSYHGNHVTKEVNKIVMCQCGMYYKGETRSCKTHLKKENKENKEVKEEMEEFIKTFISKLLFRIINLKYQNIMKEISKLYCVDSIFNIIGNVIFKEGRCLLYPLFEKSNKLKESDYQFLTYYLILPLLYHPLSSPLLYLLNKHNNRFKLALYEYYSTTTFDEMKYNFQNDTQIILKIINNSLSIMINPNIKNITNTSHKVGIKRCSKVLNRISKDIEMCFKEKDIFIKTMKILLSVYDIKQNHCISLFSDFVRFFETTLHKLPQQLLTTFLNKLDYIPIKAHNSILTKIYNVGDIENIYKYSRLFPSLLDFKYSSIDIIIPSDIKLNKEISVDPYNIEMKSNNDQEIECLDEMKIMIQFHTLWEEVTQLTSEEFYKTIKMKEYGEKELVVIVWLLCYNPTKFYQIVNELYLTNIRIKEDRLNGKDIMNIMNKLHKIYYQHPFFINPFMPLFPEYSVIFTVLIREQMNLPLDKYNNITARRDILSESELTRIMSESPHYHFIVMVLWQRIDAMVSITNDPFVTRLVIHMLKYIRMNPRFKREVIGVLIEYEGVTAGVQRIIFKNKKLYE